MLEWLAGVDSRAYSVIAIGFPNRKNDPPLPVFILREG